MFVTKTNLFSTEQEKFWAGRFGTDYIYRRDYDEYLASNLSFFSKILKSCTNLNNVIELGSNIGININALKLLFPKIKLEAVEINYEATKILKKRNKDVLIHNDSIINFDTNKKFDLVLVKGVLIHINPNNLNEVYKKMFKFSSKYILICEYYNPTPVSVEYRGYKEKLFKRDFAGDIMKLFPDLQLVDYGFCYHKDKQFNQDDITWFLIKK